MKNLIISSLLLCSLSLFAQEDEEDLYLEEDQDSFQERTPALERDIFDNEESQQRQEYDEHPEDFEEIEPDQTQ